MLEPLPRGLGHAGPVVVRLCEGGTPVRGAGQEAALQPPSGGTPLLPRGGPPVLYPLQTVCAVTLPCPWERGCLAWWGDAAGCLPHHALSLLQVFARALPLLAARLTPTMSVSAVCVGKLRHGAVVWFALVANQWQSQDPGAQAPRLGCAPHRCGAGADARTLPRGRLRPRARGQAARLPSHTAGLPGPARQLSCPVMDSCRALFCIINNVF